jgi:hypothetical protein
VTHARWRELEVQLDDEDPEFDRLPRSDQHDVLYALEVFARTGRGGSAAKWAAGAIWTDVIPVGRLEVGVDIYPDHPAGPALVVTSISLAEPESSDED